MYLILKIDPVARTGTVYARSRSMDGARRIIRAKVPPPYFVLRSVHPYPLATLQSLPYWAGCICETEAGSWPEPEAALIRALELAIGVHGHRPEGIPSRPELQAAAALLPCPASWIWP